MTESEIIHALYNSLNQNDVSAFLALCSPDVIRIEPGTHATAGTYRGHAALRGHLESGRSTWAEGGCNPEQIQQFGKYFVVFVYVHVRLKEKTEWLEGRVGDVFKIENGKVTEFRTFWDQKEAVAWAKTKITL